MADTFLKKIVELGEDTEEVSEKTIKDTATELGMEQLFTMDNIEMKTDLNPKLILAMSRGDIFAEIYKSDVMRNFIKIIEKRSVSKGRKGRGELVALVRNSQEVMDFAEDPSDSSLSKLLGK